MRIIANLHPCEKCGRRAKYVVVLPFVTRAFFACGIHRRAFAPNACYRLNDA